MRIKFLRLLYSIQCIKKWFLASIHDPSKVLVYICGFFVQMGIQIMIIVCNNNNNNNNSGLLLKFLVAL